MRRFMLAAAVVLVGGLVEVEGARAQFPGPQFGAMLTSDCYWETPAGSVEMERSPGLHGYRVSTGRIPGTLVSAGYLMLYVDGPGGVPWGELRGPVGGVGSLGGGVKIGGPTQFSEVRTAAGTRWTLQGPGGPYVFTFPPAP